MSSWISSFVSCAMCVDLFVVFLLVANPLICEASSGAGLHWLTEQYLPQITTHGSRNQIHHFARGMLQDDGSQCDCTTLRQNIYTESRQTWFMNETILSRNNINIQCAVDCANPLDTIMLSTESTIQLQSTIVINKPITISSFHDEEVGSSYDTYPAAKRKTTITCPDNANEGIFSIKSGGVIIANLEIKDCSDRDRVSPIVIGRCRNTNEGVKIHRVNFVNNRGSSQPVTIETSSKSISCGTLEMKSILFKSNKADKNTVFVKIRSRTDMKDIRVESNTRINNTGYGNAFFLFTTPSRDDAVLTINGLVATGNNIPILEARFGDVKISNSVFKENEVQSVDKGTNQDSSMIKYSSVSKALIRNCSFSDNIGGGRAIIRSDDETSLDIIRSTFNQNSKFGSVIFSTQSVLNILKSDMSSNSGNLNGGVLHLKSSVARITNSTFSDNMSDENGGVVYAIETSYFTVQRSTFVNNTAREGGCFYIEASNFRIVKSTFQRNKASVDGGAIRLERGGVKCRNSTFEYNTALDDGGAFNIETATYVDWRGVIFRFNQAAFGSAVRIVKCREKVLWRDVDFRHAVVGLTGAASYIDDSNVTIIGAYFQNNTAPYGGALYAQSFDIIIKNAVFVNNSAHVMGGAISGDNGTITFEDAIFIENSSTLGGALHFYNTTFTASEVSFLHNNASEGAGLLCKESEVKIRPRSDDGVKQLKPVSKRVKPHRSFGIYARDNRAIDSGGVIAAKVSNVQISFGRFQDNSAPEGGAIQITSNKKKSFQITNCTFNGNVADIRGGGIAARASDGDLSVNLSSIKFNKCISDQGGAIFFTSVNTIIEDCTFASNTAADGGAGVIQKSRIVLSDGETFTNRKSTKEIKVTVKDCNFMKNKAGTRGGALMLEGELIADRQFIMSEDVSKGFKYAEDGFSVTIEYVKLTENRAYSEGGAIYGKAINLDIQNVKVRDNIAAEGGGLHLVQSSFEISGSVIANNRAESGGGGSKIAQESNGNISSTLIADNHVTKEGEGGGISVSGSTVKCRDLLVKGNNATFGGGISLMLGTERDLIVKHVVIDSRLLCFNCTLVENEASQSGGGLNIQSQDTNNTVIAQLENCVLQNNIADVFGGGIHFSRPVDRSKNKSKTSNGYLVIVNSNFTNNAAGRSGRSLISYDRYKVLAECSVSTNTAKQYDFLHATQAEQLRDKNTGYCPQWTEELHTKNVSVVSSYVKRCNGTVEKDDSWRTINDSFINSIGTVPGERLPDIMVHCYDEFDNIAKSDSDGFTATLKSTDEGDLQGIFVANLEKGTGKFTGVRNPADALSFNGSYTYQLEISFSLDYVLPITIQMNVRECRINEEKESEGVLCKKCDATQYNFDPMSESCKPCDDTLNCSTPFVRPGENYWHLSPCHVPAQKCLTAYACEGAVAVEEKVQEEEYKNIKEVLDNYSCNKSEAARKEYQKLLCKEGYEGVLCGSCKADYGRSLSFACTKCNSPGLSVLILGSVCIWLALIAGITIRGSMTIEERLSVIKKKLSNLAARNPYPIKESLPEEVDKEDNNTLDTIKEDKAEQLKDQSFGAGSSSRRLHQRIISGLSRSTSMFHWLGSNLPTDTVDTIADCSEQINNLRLAQLAKWKLVEVFKVTINFLQAIAIAAVINVEWTRYMLTMFNISAFTGGASTALVTRAIHCLPWWNGTKHAAYAGLVSGLLVPIIVILCIVAFFAFLAYKLSKGMYYFVKRSVLATLAISYFSYLSITRVAVMFFYCVGVHTNEDYFSNEETYYWALDTSIQCSASYHKRLMVFGGILFALFSVGFPLGSAAILVLFRKDSGHDDPQWMSDILGFLYRAYKRKFVFWESTVMLRKALLSVIAVFSYHLGGHTQGLLASSILSVCLFFQAICKPYRHEFETVNNHESLSLLVSGITFTIAQFFTKDRTDQTVKVTLSVLLMIAIIGFMTYMVVSMAICFVDVLKTDLKVSGELDDEDKNSWSVVGNWVASRLGFSDRPSNNNNNDDDVELELGSIKSDKADDDGVADCSS